MVVKAGRILNIGVALLKYYADLNLNQSGQYGQIYAEKFTSASLICKVIFVNLFGYEGVSFRRNGSGTG